jgi:glycosyltransferase involved in cell wall biosynthesis
MNKTLKILAVIPGSEEGTSMIFSKRQVKSLIDSGLQVRSFYLKSRISIIVLWKEAGRFRKFIKEYQPDIIHSHYGTVTAFFCSLLTLKPIVITFQGSDLNYATDAGWFRNFFTHFLSHLASIRAKKIICVSEKLKEKVIFGKKKVSIVPFGVNIENFTLIPPAEARNKLNLPDEKKIVLFNASNPKIKRIDIAKKVESSLKERGNEVQFIYFSGSVSPENMVNYLNAADVLLMCSDSEGSPVMIKEAMACNLPVVSTDVGDVKERIQNVRLSFIVQKNIDDFVQAIEEIFRLNQRSDGRKALLEQGLTEKDNSDKVISVYQQILNTGGR